MKKVKITLGMFPERYERLRGQRCESCSILTSVFPEITPPRSSTILLSLVSRFVVNLDDDDCIPYAVPAAEREIAATKRTILVHDHDAMLPDCVVGVFDSEDIVWNFL